MSRVGAMESASEDAIGSFTVSRCCLTARVRTAERPHGVFGFTEDRSRRLDDSLSKAADDNNGAFVDIHQAKGFEAIGRGSVHHIAFRAADDDEQAGMAKRSSTIIGCIPPNRRTASISVRFIFASRGVFFSKSQPIAPASMSTSRATLGRPDSCRLTMSATALTSRRPCRNWEAVKTDVRNSFIASKPAQRPDAPTVALPHGTGGNENDLFPSAQIIARAPRCCPRADRSSKTACRAFSRRLAEGVFDYEDVRRRAIELAQFVVAAKDNYQMAPPIAVGYSNGANIAAAVLLLKPDVLAGAVLFRAMLPLDPRTASPILPTCSVLITSGRCDSVIPPESANRLAALLKAAGAQVSSIRFVPDRP